jgi:simple sugar transport system ATP-binding protein
MRGEASPSTAPRAIALEATGLSKRFGAFQALDRVSLRVPAGEFHALLGENGAGKSTLVKCLMGFHRADEGAVLLDGREVAVRNPREAQALGLGMVYQHFTLVPSLTAAENLVIARRDTPAIIAWTAERRRIEDFLERTPFRVPLDRRVGMLSAGERQKLEVLKLLYLDQRFMILDEPTSVLTPAEADELLGHLKSMTECGAITVLMITHKLREARAFADAVTVLRRGRIVGGGRGLSTGKMAAMMVGEAAGTSDTGSAAPPERHAMARPSCEPALELAGLFAEDDDGRPALRGVSLKVEAGEIVGIAGVSGNGQSAIVEACCGQRPLSAGRIFINGRDFVPTRRAFDEAGLFVVQEEPLRNAVVAGMSVGDNIVFRRFDKPPLSWRGWWLDPRAIRAKGRELMARFRVASPSPDVPIGALSGGNVQRAVLARELSAERLSVLIVANPCFGLDFASAAEIRERLAAARNAGAAVLLISEDLDEVLDLSDTVAVISHGRITYKTPIAEVDRSVVGLRMAGGADG